MKNILYSRPFKFISGLLFIAALAVSLTLGVSSVATYSIFGFSESKTDSYYNTNTFKYNFLNNASSITNHILKLEPTPNIEAEDIAINLVDYKTNNVLSYTYDTLGSFNSFHLPYTFKENIVLEDVNNLNDTNDENSLSEVNISTISNYTKDIKEDAIVSLAANYIDETTYNSLISYKDYLSSYEYKTFYYDDYQGEITPDDMLNNAYYIMSSSDYIEIIKNYGYINNDNDGNLINSSFSADSYIYEKMTYFFCILPRKIFFIHQIMDGSKLTILYYLILMICLLTQKIIKIYLVPQRKIIKKLCFH